MIHIRPDVSLPSDDTPLWRYQDLPQFLAVLQRRSLFLPAVQLLADPFEGSQTNRAVFFREIVLRSHLRDSPETEADELRRRLRVEAESLREEVFVSCWHASHYESEAMWRLYGVMGRGVAMKSSVSRLKAILTQHRWEFIFGQVRYIDNDEGDASTVDDVVRFLRKRRAFSHEQEVRFLIHPAVTRDQGLALLAERDRNRPGGLEMSLDPTDLIECVLVAPHAPGWYVDVVGEAVARHGFKIPVAQSALSARPLF